jgi:predicted DNA-binding transcriptional regulator AlpA
MNTRLVTPNAPKKRSRTAGTVCVWPAGVQARYGISLPTRWRWEKDGKLPPRDVFVGGVAIGWRPETLEAAERGTPA